VHMCLIVLEFIVVVLFCFVLLDFEIFLSDAVVYTGTVTYPGIFFQGGGSTNSVEDRG
jgi:hypothetical protein